MSSYFLDCSHQLCPVPILMTEERVQTMKSGDVVEVLFTDPGATEDLKAWCRMTGNEFFDLKIEKNILKELLIDKRAIQNKDIPLKRYNYSYVLAICKLV